MIEIDCYHPGTRSKPQFAIPALPGERIPSAVAFGFPHAVKMIVNLAINFGNLLIAKIVKLVFADFKNPFVCAAPKIGYFRFISEF
jgi:hypothetical protein